MTHLHRSATGLAILFAVTPWLGGDRPAAADAAAPLLPSIERREAVRQDPGSGVQRTPPASPRMALHFTAPADTPGPHAGVDARHPPRAVRGYQFLQVDPSGHTTLLKGYADSVGSALLTPHPPGTRESVWLEPTEREQPRTIFVLSLGWNGSPSARSNGISIAAVVSSELADASHRPSRIELSVPRVAHPPARSGQAALEMVMRYYGAGAVRAREACGGHTRASSIGALAAAARRAGYAARVVTLTPDSLIDLVVSRVPPILLYANRPRATDVTRFGVVTGWDPARGTFTLLDGSAQARVVGRADLARQWQTAGSQALVVRRALAPDAGSPAGP